MPAQLTLSSRAVPATADAAPRAPWYCRWWDAVRQAYRRQRQRRELLYLDDRTLADIGVTRSEAIHEGSKAFWQAPDPIGHPIRNIEDLRFGS
jgi:uncharacterized protein YjiS (DUF1127 family)